MNVKFICHEIEAFRAKQKIRDHKDFMKGIYKYVDVGEKKK